MEGQGRLALVTGGAGFIGGHLCEGLVAAGWQVRVLDDLSSGMDFLVMQGMLYKLGRRKAQAWAEELLELVGLTDVADP